MSLQKSKPYWELMLPEEFRDATDALPVCFMPLGTVEWRGENNALGLDSLKAQALCVRAAEKASGGIVHPPLYGGMGGLNQSATVKIEGEQSWENDYLRPWTWLAQRSALGHLERHPDRRSSKLWSAPRC